MSPLWAYFLPIAGFAIVIGGVAGLLWFKRENRLFGIAGGALVIAAAALWHGPFGAADRFVAKVEPSARYVLVDWEMGQVQSHLHHRPLSRRLVLSGPADDFQRAELVRIMSTLPGVSTATWSASSPGIPLIAEAAAASVAGFLLGLLVAYAVDRRRRHNAQWRW